MINIRFCTTEDAALVADMSRQTFYETFASENSAENMDKFMQTQFSREVLVKEVGAGGDIFFLAYDDEKPVGYVRMREGDKLPELGNRRTIEIARIYAVMDSIGKGVGSVLMQKCIEVALERNKEVIWLGVWEKNKRAIDFYTRWGFEKFSTHVFMLGDDPQTDWLMKKEL
ncbi:MAG: GNAT family N-acetyltransferase [Chitinophagaceae bacterium]|nr:GNAT family N-acetyltransferase [Chitinophagaceae bacterium]